MIFDSAKMKETIKSGTAVLWNGRILDRVEDVPTDQQIAEARKEALDEKAKRLAGQ